MIGNRLIVAGAVAAAALLALPATAQKVGVIEVQRIVQESAVGKESLARIQKIQAAKQEDLTKRQNELRDLEKKIQEQGKSLSEEAMEKLQKDYQAKALDLKRFQDDAQRELEELQRKELGELERRVLPVIEAVAKELGYSLVFNKFQSGLLHAEPGVDITDAVIQKFNTAIAAAPKTDAKPAPAAPAPGPEEVRGGWPSFPQRRPPPRWPPPAAGGSSATGPPSSRACGRSRRRALAISPSPPTRRPRRRPPRRRPASFSRGPPSLSRAGPSSRCRTRSAALAAVLARAFPRRVGAAGRPPDGDRRRGGARRPRGRGRPVRRRRRGLGRRRTGRSSRRTSSSGGAAGSATAPGSTPTSSSTTASPSGRARRSTPARSSAPTASGTPPVRQGSGRSPRSGGVEIGADAEIGANTCVDRATLEVTRVGDGTKVDDLVMIGHNCDVGRHVVLCGQVGLAGSTTVGDQAVLGGQVGAGGHLRIGKGVKVGGQTGVSSDVPDGATIFGTPHMPYREALRVNAELKRLPETARLVRELGAEAAAEAEVKG